MSCSPARSRAADEKVKRVYGYQYEIDPTPRALTGGVQEEGRRSWLAPTANHGAPRDEWEMFWKKLPPPGHHDIFALFKRGKLTIEGDLHPFMANLLYIKDVLAAPRKESRQ